MSWVARVCSFILLSPAEKGGGNAYLTASRIDRDHGLLHASLLLGDTVSLRKHPGPSLWLTNLCLVYALQRGARGPPAEAGPGVGWETTSVELWGECGCVSHAILKKSSTAPACLLACHTAYLPVGCGCRVERMGVQSMRCAFSNIS